MSLTVTSVRVNQAIFIVVVAVQLCLLLFSLDLPFFWDSIQFGSRHATFLLQQGLSWLPREIDSGNPPFLGWLIAQSWRFAGQSLWVAHLVMWPFVLGNLLLFARLGQALSAQHWAWLPLLMLANPVYASQTTLTSPDVLLMTGILLVWTGRIRNASTWMLAGSMMLGLVSLRGGVLLGGLVLWWMLDSQHRPWVRWLLIGSLPGWGYHLGHWLELGWVLVPAGSPWSASFTWNSISSIPRQTGILLWRMVDHGQVFLWCGLAYVAWRYPERIRASRVWAWLFLFLIVITPFFIFFDLLNMHRYLLPVSLGATALFIHIMNDNRWLSLVVLLGLMSGNAWIYPDGVAKGWDATLSWMTYPYHRKQVLSCMESQGIPIEETASAFPNLGPEDEILLNGSQRAFLDRAEGLNVPYVLYSNVYNDFSDAEIAELSSWTIRCQSGHWPVRVVLYEHPRHD